MIVMKMSHVYTIYVYNRIAEFLSLGIIYIYHIYMCVLSFITHDFSCIYLSGKPADQLSTGPTAKAYIMWPIGWCEGSIPYTLFHNLYITLIYKLIINLNYIFCVQNRHNSPLIIAMNWYHLALTNNGSRDVMNWQLLLPLFTFKPDQIPYIYVFYRILQSPNIHSNPSGELENISFIFMLCDNLLVIKAMDTVKIKYSVISGPFNFFVFLYMHLFDFCCLWQLTR